MGTPIAGTHRRMGGVGIVVRLPRRRQRRHKGGGWCVAVVVAGVGARGGSGVEEIVVIGQRAPGATCVVCITLCPTCGIAAPLV